MDKRLIAIVLCCAGVILAFWALLHQPSPVDRASSAFGTSSCISSIPSRTPPPLRSPFLHTQGTCILVQPDSDGTKKTRSLNQVTGTVTKSVVEIGPIDIHQKYRSMDGPRVATTFSIDKLVALKKIVVPEPRIQLLENGLPINAVRPIGKNDSLFLSDRARQIKLVRLAQLWNSIHQFKTQTGRNELFWFNGVKVDVIDENGLTMPQPEFLCHVNIDIRFYRHCILFPHTTPGAGGRIIILSQGTTRVMLPAGTGIPFAGDEQLIVSAQPANRSTDKCRFIKLRLTFYFVKDRELSQPMSALSWGTADLIVASSQANRKFKSPCADMCCSERSQADDAPNNKLHRLHKVLKDAGGHTLSWHWIVPPGVHKYYAPVNDERWPDFADQGPIKTVWLHVHPYCKSVSLIEYSGNRKRVLYTARSQTLTKPALGIQHNDFLTFSKGILLNKNAGYGIEAVYNNTSGQPQDAMVIAGMFFTDLKFQKPAWAMKQPRSERL